MLKIQYCSMLFYCYIFDVSYLSLWNLYIKKDHLRILWHGPYYGDCREEGFGRAVALPLFCSIYWGCNYNRVRRHGWIQREGAWGVFPPPLPRRWHVAFRHNWYSVTPFLSGAHPPKKNPGSAPERHDKWWNSDSLARIETPTTAWVSKWSPRSLNPATTTWIVSYHKCYFDIFFSEYFSPY